MSLRMRRGSAPTIAQPSFGPLPNEQTIRDGAQPRDVLDPGGGITFTSRADLQTKINANASNSMFVAAGNTTYTWDASISDGGKHPRIYFLGDPDLCSINMSGLELPGAINGSITGGEVHGGKFRLSGTSNEASHGLFLRTGWLAEDVICENNFARGIAITSDSGAITIRRSIARNNGRYGIAGGQQTASTWGPTGCLLEDVQVSGNNTRHLGIGGDAGGTKFSSGFRNGTFRRCWFHDNYGSGLWFDGYHSGNLVEDSVFENNRNWGVFVELGYGSSTFRRLYLKDNASALPTDPVNTGVPDWYKAVQFLISCVDGTLVANEGGAYGTGTSGGTGVIFRDSYIEDTGIDSYTRAMGVITHDTHPIPAKDCHFLHNQLWLRNTTALSGGAGAGQVGGLDADSTQILWNEIMEFDNNEYHVGSTAVGVDYFKWAGSGEGDPRDWTEWRAFGKDTNSTMVVI